VIRNYGKFKISAFSDTTTHVGVLLAATREFFAFSLLTYSLKIAARSVCRCKQSYRINSESYLHCNPTADLPE